MKSPAFQFYPADWLMDEDVLLMTPAQEWCYFRMILVCWKLGSLPDNNQSIAILISKGGSTTLQPPLNHPSTTLEPHISEWFTNDLTKLVESVRHKFYPDPNTPGRVLNKRLEKEKLKQAVWAEKSKIGGKRSGISRSKGGSRVVQPPLKRSGSTVVEPNTNSSSSPSGMKKKTEPSSSPDSSGSGSRCAPPTPEPSGSRTYTDPNPDPTHNATDPTYTDRTHNPDPTPTHADPTPTETVSQMLKRLNQELRAIP